MSSAHHSASADRYFYAQGVKTNVLFFTKGTVANPHQDKNCTDDVWVYDLRTNMPSFGKRTPFTDEHLQPFERVYGEDPHGLSPRTEGEWSFNAEETEVADSEENKTPTSILLPAAGASSAVSGSAPQNPIRWISPAER